MPSKPIIAAVGCDNLEKLVLRYDDDAHDIKGVLSEWVHVGFQPPNLDIVLHIIQNIAEVISTQ